MVKRIFVEKKPGFDIEAGHLLEELKSNLQLSGLEKVRIINRYDIEGISDDEYAASRTTIFSEPNVDNAYDETVELGTAEVFCIAYLPGQYDQRADSASQCIQLLTQKEAPAVRYAKVIALEGKISDEELAKIKKYMINPVDSEETSMDKPETLELVLDKPAKIKVLEGFTSYTDDEICAFHKENGMAMSAEDLAFVRDYFKSEGRDPYLTEIKVIDTYWSDHCRHTTFATRLNSISVEENIYTEPVKEAIGLYKELRNELYKGKEKTVCLMDIATIGMKALKKAGKLNDLDESDEINACSIVVPVDIDGKTEEYVVMFKNETHNHPTEIEPFGGAATCLGGAIRDPLSGRSYVYQAMRITGSGDVRKSVDETLQGKLPQRKISTGAAHGYSSYGNQIGLATGLVNEIYDEGYVAKRMEIGAVIGAAPRRNIVRKKLNAGDKIILLGGRTGRDGCGGATGSSKAHTLESINVCGAEVQKGNPPTERKIQRLFRNPEASTLIKKCNDFGAGGVCVAIGELSDGLDIDLDKVKKKYEGLDGTELAISESQERMAVVVDDADVEKFMELARTENLEAEVVAVVKDTGRLKMTWQGEVIVDISRDFLNTNGVTQNAEALISAPKTKPLYFENSDTNGLGLKERLLANLSKLNVCSQKGLSERFDSTIGRGTVLMPFGGKYQHTPPAVMAAKIPLEHGQTDTATLMSYGFIPELSKWSPFHGAVFAVIQSLSRITAAGGDWSKARLTFQEYFERLGDKPERWGKPASALLGALYAQYHLGTAAIGGKDSMSGSFMDMDVPPTLVSFAVTVDKASELISPEFKNTKSKIVLLRLPIGRNGMPELEAMKTMYTRVYELIHEGRILACSALETGGVISCIAKMCFGNMIGARIDYDELFSQEIGSLIVEVPFEFDSTKEFVGIQYMEIGRTIEEKALYMDKTRVTLEECLQVWTSVLKNVFPAEVKASGEAYNIKGKQKQIVRRPRIQIAKPRVLIPVFPGTNCEYDTAYCFEKAGAICETFVINNLTPEAIEQSIAEMEKAIKNSQIIMLPGGFSGGDEPDGSGKFIATTFRNERIKNAVNDLLTNRDGLMLGICNGFQALIKLGLVPYGEICDISEASPTLTYNNIGRHMSSLVYTRIASKLSPWLRYSEIDEVYCTPISHGEGRFVCNDEVLQTLIAQGQIATQYVDMNGNASMNMPYNPNGSVMAIEGITSPDGRVLGKMAHVERISNDLCINVPGNKEMQIFRAGVDYFI